MLTILQHTLVKRALLQKKKKTLAGSVLRYLIYHGNITALVLLKWLPVSTEQGEEESGSQTADRSARILPKKKKGKPLVAVTMVF